MKYRRLIIFIVIFVLVLGVYGTAVWFLYSINIETQRLIKNTIEQEKEMRDEIAIKAFSDEIAKNTGSLEGVVISKNGEVDFIEFLESLGKQQKIKLNIASVKEVKGEVFDSLVFQITGEGSWGNLLSFLQLIEVMPTQSHIRSVDFHVLADGVVANKGKTVGPSSWRLALEMSVNKIPQ